jgi:hypothetical protein
MMKAGEQETMELAIEKSMMITCVGANRFTGDACTSKDQSVHQNKANMITLYTLISCSVEESSYQYILPCEPERYSLRCCKCFALFEDNTKVYMNQFCSHSIN